MFTRGSPDDKFVVYKGGDGLLNKLYEAQLFIQQAVAVNSVFYFERACVIVRIHVLRAAWTVTVAYDVLLV